MSQVRRVAGSAALVLVDGVTPLRPEPALFESMLEGWGRQQRSRRLSGPLIESRERLVRRFQAFTMAWPWAWTPEQVETWSGSGGWAHSTIRSYQGALAVFLDYVCDTRYGWLAECEQRVGARPVQVCHEWNTAAHVADYEGRPERRPLTRVELQAFLDAADDRVESAALPEPQPRHRRPLDAPGRSRLEPLRRRHRPIPRSPTLTNTTRRPPKPRPIRRVGTLLSTSLDASGGNLLIARDAGGWASATIVEEIYAHVDMHDPAFDAALRAVWGE